MSIDGAEHHVTNRTFSLLIIAMCCPLSFLEETSREVTETRLHLPHFWGHGASCRAHVPPIHFSGFWNPAATGRPLTNSQLGAKSKAGGAEGPILCCGLMDGERETGKSRESFESKYETNEPLYHCTSVFLAKKKREAHITPAHTWAWASSCTFPSFSRLLSPWLTPTDGAEAGLAPKPLPVPVPLPPQLCWQGQEAESNPC